MVEYGAEVLMAYELLALTTPSVLAVAQGEAVQAEFRTQ